ncbi:MAG: trigger factor [Lachnospiraceae bacterium]|nr:trigger factor [Lachnospiraceae bacterium]
MRRIAKFSLCVMAAALLAAGCGKKESGETASSEETTAQVQEETPKGTVTLGEYKGLEITNISTEVSDEQVDAQIEFVLSTNPEMIEITDRSAQEGDVVNIDFVGMKDGEAFEGGTAEGYDLELGSGSFIDGFEDGLIGAEIGDELSLNLTFPENYGNAELAGQPVVFDVTVNKIQEKKDAELTDEFVKKISDTSKTVEEYRSEIRKNLEDSAKQNAEIQMQNEAIEQVLASSTFEGLDEEVDGEFQIQMAEMTQALEQSNMTLADYVTMYGTDEDSFKEYMRSDIKARIQVSLLAEAIVKEENLVIDDDARMKVAKAYGLDSPADLVEAYGQEAVDEAARNVAVMDFLLQNANLVEAEPTESETQSESAEETTGQN